MNKMVKISNPKYNSISMSQDTIQEAKKTFVQDPTQKDKKNANIHVRLNHSISRQLRRYALEHNTNITNSVERIINEKFMNKKIDRDYFNLSEEAPLLVPQDDDLITMYLSDSINLLVAIQEDEKAKYTIKTFDKQEEIYNKNKNDFIILKIQRVNNVLDQYDKENDCYYTMYNYNDTKDPFKNHLGVCFITRLQTKINVDEKSTKKTTEEIIPILVQSYDNVLEEARIISQEELLQLSEEVNNHLLYLYVSNSDDFVNIRHIELVYEEKNKLRQQVNNLLFENTRLKKSLEKENNNDEDKTNSTLIQLEEENKQLQEELKNTQEKLYSIESAVNNVIHKNN